MNPPGDENDIQELIELAEEAMAYVPEYFLKKWHMEKELKILKARLAHANSCGRPDNKDRAAMIIAALCFVGLLAWPQQELLFALVGASVLFVSLARQWL